MKKIIFSGLMLFIWTGSHAQTDTSYIEQYCQVIATPRLLSNKVTIEIDHGEEKSIWVDTRVKDLAGRLRKFNTIIDALNFMGQQGWIFINAYPVKSHSTEIYHFAFKRSFKRSELIKQQ